MALWTIVAAGLALELPTLAAIDGATTAATASDTRTTAITGEFSTASLLPSPTKDEIDEGLPQLRMDGWSPVIEAHRDGLVTTPRSTPTTTEMILTTGGNGDSSSYESTDGYQHESSSEVNFKSRPTALASALSERSFTSTESPSKPSKPSSSSGAASPAVLPKRGINIDPPAMLFGISPPARIYVPASDEFIASSYGSSSTKKSLITDPVEDGNYALTEDSARVTDATSSSSGNRAVETIENYGTVLARNNDAQGSRPGGYVRPAVANLSSAAPSSSTINEFIEAEPPSGSSSSSFTAKSSTEHSQEDENMKNAELGSGGRANVGRTTAHASSAAAVGRSNEARKHKEATSQDGSPSEIPLIMVTASTKRQEEAEGEEPMVPDGEGREEEEEEAGVSPYACISTSCHGTREGLKKAKKTALDGTRAWERKAEESLAISTPLFRLITKGQLPAKRERRLSFNASSTSGISTSSSSSTSSSGSSSTAISTAITSTSRESPAPLPSLSEYSEGGTTPDTPESPVTIFQMGITASRRSDIGFSSPTATTTTTNPALRRFLESGGGLSIAHSHNQLTRQQQQQQQQQQLRRGHNDNGNSTKVIAPVDQWPVKHSAVVEGDLVLGGLMMVHEREDTVTCGPVMPQGGIQALEAMLYTLDRLNEREIVPGVKVGAHILDDCDKDTYGLEMAVDFIKGECFPLTLV